MKYWPTSVIAARLPPEQRAEVVRLDKNMIAMSHAAMVACHQTAFNIPADTSIAIIQSENAMLRRTYLNRPAVGEFERLERSGFIDTGSGFCFIQDGLH